MDDEGDSERPRWQTVLSSALFVLVILYCTLVLNSPRPDVRFSGRGTNIVGLVYDEKDHAYYVDRDVHHFCDGSQEDCIDHVCLIAALPEIDLVAIDPTEKGDANCLGPFNDSPGYLERNGRTIFVIVALLWIGLGTLMTSCVPKRVDVLVMIFNTKLPILAFLAWSLSEEFSFSNALFGLFLLIHQCLL